MTDSGFYVDEAHEALRAKALNIENLGFYLVNEIEFLQIFAIKISFLVFGVSEFSTRFPSLVFSIASIFLVVHMGIKLHDEKTGYLAGFLMAISAWHVKWSIIAKPYSLFIFLSLLTMYFLYKAISTDKKRYSCLMVIAFIFSVLTSRFSLILPLIIFGYILANNKLKNRNIWIGLLPLLTVFLAVVMYVVVNRAFESIYLETKDQWWASSDPSFYIILTLDKLTVLAILCLLFGAYRIVNRKENTSTLSIIYVGIYFIVISYFFFSKIDRYMSPIIPFVYILVAFGFWEIICWIKKAFNPSKALTVFILIFLCLGDLAMFIPPNREEGYRENYTVEWREAVDYMSDHWKEGDYAITTVTDITDFYFERKAYSIFYDWENTTDLIWRTNIPINSSVWFVADKGRFYNAMYSWQQDWIWQNFELVWESDHNYVFKSG